MTIGIKDYSRFLGWNLADHASSAISISCIRLGASSGRLHRPCSVPPSFLPTRRFAADDRPHPHAPQTRSSQVPRGGRRPCAKPDSKSDGQRTQGAKPMGPLAMPDELARKRRGHSQVGQATTGLGRRRYEARRASLGYQTAMEDGQRWDLVSLPD